MLPKHMSHIVGLDALTLKHMNERVQLIIRSPDNPLAHNFGTFVFFLLIHLL